MTTIELDIAQTIGIAAVLLVVGDFIKNRVGLLSRYFIPGPIIGGLVFSLIALVGHQTGLFTFQFYDNMRAFLLLVFFTTIGFSASFELLKKGGVGVALFLAAAVGLVVLQNLLGAGLAAALGVHPLIGVAAGSISLTGGHGTSAAFGPLLEHELSKIPTANAMLRTTTAPTMLTGSIKANVLPQQASSIVNFRLHPRDSIDAVLAHATQVIADPRVELSVVQGMAASRVSDKQAAGFARISEAAQRAYAAPAGTAATDLIVVSGLTIGGTDSRMYEAVAKDSYRFNPMLLTSAELGGFHGNNERISQDNLHKAVLFYHTLLGSL